MLIGIIGGNGKMGRWFRRFFEKNKYRVLTADKNTRLSNIQLAKRCDIVIISVPISKTVEVINEVKRHVKKDALLMDMTSVKVAPMNAMLRGTQCHVLGCHPVFGPTISSIKGQTVILCRGRGERQFSWLKSLLQKNRAKVNVTTAKKHDRIMASIQGLLHFSSIAFCHALKQLKVDINDSIAHSSPVYRLRLTALGRILNQNPELYADIEFSNKEIPKALNALDMSGKKLLSIIKSKDRKQFMRFFKEAAKHLGSFRSRAQKESDSLVDRMVNI